MAVEQTITIEHDEIKTWVDGHGGAPAKVRGTGSDMTDPAVLRIDFSGEDGDPQLERIEWDAWLESCTAQKMAAVFAEPDREGGTPFCKITAARNVT
jgi:hypothetical protein